MKVIALTYDYDLGKLSDIGRTWAKDVYRGKDFIFEYSAASYATFVDKNPPRDLHIYTDDVELLMEKLAKYDVDHAKIFYHDFSKNLSELSKTMKYSFEALTEFIYHARSQYDFTVKIDNDLIFYGEIPDPQENEVFVWAYERLVYQGNPLMGEIKVAEKVLGRTDIPIYNLGILGLPISYPEQELRATINKMVNVDISSVTDLDTNIWHCCEQTANNWIFYKYGYKVRELKNIVHHYFDNKKLCIEQAKYLLK